MSDSKVKKIKPYPIPMFALHEPGIKIEGMILRLEASGFMAQFTNLQMAIGEKWDIYFEIPGMQFSVKEKCQVIKTYDRIDAQRKKTYLVEFHFSIPDDFLISKINEFLSRIHQV